jgi:hypothetical protein
MAMTKKEQAAFEELRKELALTKAWKLTDPVERDLPPPDSPTELSRGWDFNTYSGTVYKACSDSFYNGNGWEKTTSQRPLALFSTFERAKAALRYAVEREPLERLARTDMMREPQD